MDVTALAAAYVGAQTSQVQMAVAARMIVQMAVAARMMKLNADAQASIIQVIEAAQETMQTVAATAAGIGENLDISV